MTGEYRRVSVNTSLKNARIFDEDSWESEGFTIGPNKIKTEPVDSSSDSEVDTKIQVKQEIETPIKQEVYTGNFMCDNAVTSPIKQERLDFERKLNFDTDEGTNDDFTNGVTTGFSDQGCATLRQRNFPCNRDEHSESNSPLKRNLSRSSSPEIKRRRVEKERRSERDPLVLKRRQKQIDFGKNTVGYDVYITQVPRKQRRADDPTTPNKYRKYSRRGWDGLIKQWRLKLHQFDPKD